MRRIIFLDVDGVLNSHIIAEEWFKRTKKGGYGGWFSEMDTPTEDVIKWGHLNFSNLREIVRATNAEIVISSDWRKSFSVDKFKEMFLVYGWKDAPIIDRTGVLKNRGLEINEWLSRNPDVEDYVIIDDNEQFLPEQLPRFVHTNPECGLSWLDTQKAINILINTYEPTRPKSEAPSVRG